SQSYHSLYDCTSLPFSSSLFFFTAPATTEIYTLSLHDALPIWRAQPDSAPGTPAPARTDRSAPRPAPEFSPRPTPPTSEPRRELDRKSTRLNSSHVKISYAVFCLKKKKKKKNNIDRDIQHTIHN